MNKSKNIQQPEKSRKPYHTPKLKNAGTLAKLTRGLGASGVDADTQPKSGGWG